MENLTQGMTFGRIALCFSGGGFRAAAYALGVLDLLKKVDLIDDVRCISTISGGTFTGVSYALSKADEKEFGQFFREFRKFLKSSNAIDQALERIYRTPSPSGSNDLSLIRAAADYYYESLFRGRLFGELLSLVREKKVFSELIFNATEFRGGNGFRFRASDNRSAFIGNQVFSIPEEVAAQIRLAEIVAASSCFPGAFEPIRFPDDFHWKSPLDAIRAELVKDIHNPAANPRDYPNGFKDKDHPMDCTPLPLMDGGIFDNQGIAATVLADSKNRFGLYLITDTSQREDDFYTVPKPAPKGRGLRLWQWVVVGVVCAILGLVSVIGTALFALFPAAAASLGPSARGAILMIAVPPVLILLFGVLKLAWLMRKYSELEISGAKFEIWKYFRNLRTADAIELAVSRFKTVLSLASSVFMKRIRQLQFNNIMSADPRPEKVAFNLIHSLDRTKEREWMWALDPALKPGRRLRELARKAEKVETKLWVDEKELENLIECGRATTCFSLLKYIWTRWKADFDAKGEGKPKPPKPNEPGSPHYDIYRRLFAEWQGFNGGPVPEANAPDVGPAPSPRTRTENGNPV